MKTHSIECYEVVEADGAGRGEHQIGMFSTHEIAQIITDRSTGWRRTRLYKDTIVIFDTVEEFEQAAKDALVKKALARLSDAERAALGY